MTGEQPGRRTIRCSRPGPHIGFLGLIASRAAPAAERGLGPHLREILKEDTIILIGGADFRGVSSLPGEKP